MRVIEAFLASVLLMSCLALIPAQKNLANSNENLDSVAQNVLLGLNGNGRLAKLVDDRDWADLKGSLESALPLTVWFNLTVLDQNMNVLNPFPISNAGTVSAKIVSTDYICASQSSDYSVYILRLQLSQVGV